MPTMPATKTTHAAAVSPRLRGARGGASERPDHDVGAELGDGDDVEQGDQNGQRDGNRDRAGPAAAELRFGAG